MRRIVLAAAVLIALLAPTARAFGEAVPDDATLESNGAVIGSITIDAGSIFDTDDPKENKRLFRGANKLHRTTRDNVIKRQLTFSEGDRFSRAALEESERALRHNGYLYDASVRPVYYEDNRVDILVKTRDTWTLRPSLGFHRSGGTNAFRFGIHDMNFLGYGKSVQLERVNTVDRVETGVEFHDPAIGGRHVRFDVGYSNNSDGKAALLALERPFWRRNEGWAAGGRGEAVERVDSLYALGEITDQFQTQHTLFEGYFGRRLGAPNALVKRLLFGFTYDQSDFTALPEWRPTAIVPADRTLSYPWIGIELIHDAYVRTRDIDKMGRTEDVDLGRTLTARVGWAATAFGADRNAAMLGLTWTSGFNPGPGQMITFAASADGRVASGGIENGLLNVTARYTKREADWNLFVLSASWSAATNLDGDKQLLLGGDNGLRGYPLRYAFGVRRGLLTIEERFYVDREYLHLMRFGAAVFADVGSCRGEVPDPAAHLGVLRDIGIGLRFGQTRSAHAGMVRIDLAIPFDALDGSHKPQLLVTTGDTF